MKDILINVVQTNMAVVGHDDEEDSNMKKYNSKDYIIGGGQAKKTLFPRNHAWAHA